MEMRLTGWGRTRGEHREERGPSRQSWVGSDALRKAGKDQKQERERKQNGEKKAGRKGINAADKMATKHRTTIQRLALVNMLQMPL